MTPVVTFACGRTRKTAGRKNVILKGLLTVFTSTPVCVPPSAVTAYCRPLFEGATSAVSVYVGDVSPVTAAPVTGLDGLKLKYGSLEASVSTDACEVTLKSRNLRGSEFLASDKGAERHP